MTQSQCKLFQLYLIVSSGLPSRRRSAVEFRRRLWTWHFIVSMSLICKILGWDQLIFQINFACNIDQIIGLIIGSGGGTYLFGDLEELQHMHTSYIGKYFSPSKEKKYVWGTKWDESPSITWISVYSYHDIQEEEITTVEKYIFSFCSIWKKTQIICHYLHLIPGCLIKWGRTLFFWTSGYPPRLNILIWLNQSHYLIQLN